MNNHFNYLIGAVFLVLSSSVLAESEVNPKNNADIENSSKSESKLAHDHTDDPEETAIEDMVAEGQRVNLIGKAISASEGLINKQEIEIRPLLRSGEILELIPGMVVTQHSGSGKANQYFLRGFNLDHGTDFATFIDGMPINMRSHGHGQGYTDLNFIIPETIDSIAYKKGPYYTEVGDFSGAGSAAMDVISGVDQSLLKFTLGEDNYQRLTSVNSHLSGNNEWLFAVELNQDDGPWTDIKEDVEKKNVLLKHSRNFINGHWQTTFMAYDNQWNSADQIPLRAVENGLIGEFGSIDPTLGGESNRYSLSSHFHHNAFTFSAYAITYDLNLWSNFTYFLDDPVNGDQFEQVDDRNIYGFKASYETSNTLFGKTAVNEFGLDFRYDDIDEVGLYKTRERSRLGAIRSDAINQSSAGLYWQNEIQWHSQFKSTVGVRYDYFDFDVSSRIDENINGVDLTPNTGETDDDIFSVKTNFIYTINDSLEAYASIGQGFHSNDARGTVIQVDPGSDELVEQVDPLVSSLGYELGMRMFLNERINASVALWRLELDSELLFVGDAGNTEPSGESQRQGVELTGYYRLSDNWTLDLEYAYSDAEFTEAPTSENEIPGSIEHVVQTGLSFNDASGWFGSLRFRYFGERPLIEDGSVFSDSSTITNLKAGLRKNNWIYQLEVLNLFDSDDHDIDYFYTSRLESELNGPGVDDIHYHIFSPRNLRLSLQYNF